MHTAPKWKDTSHSKGDNGEPRTWQCDIAGERLSVTRLHGHDGWWRLGLFAPVHRQLKSANIEDAKREALDIVRETIKTISTILAIKE